LALELHGGKKVLGEVSPRLTQSKDVVEYDMALGIVFVPSAFRHNVSEESIRWVLSHYLADAVIEEGNETKRLAVGFDKSGNLLEIIYNELEDDRVKVFHAMKCRKQFRRDLGIEE